MQQTKKIVSIILCFALFVCCSAGLAVAAVEYPVKAEIKNAFNKGVAQIYSLPGTTGHETAENKNQSQKVAELPDGASVMVLGEALDGDGDMWYKIKFGDNLENEGYAYYVHVILRPEYKFDEDFEANLLNFPTSYHDALRTLHAEYPNWKFVADNISLTLEQAVNEQYSAEDVTKTRKYVELTYGGAEWRDPRAYNAATDSWLSAEDDGRWTYASRMAIEYFMDPRNSLNAESIFVFLQQSYDQQTQTKDGLRTIVKDSFLERGYDGNTDAYLDDIMAAASETGVSPYVLAATIRIEQGADGASGLICGTYPGYEGYYNFFNFGASGDDTDTIVRSGLEHAKGQGWTSRRASIIGGAHNYKDGYIDVGQDTYYYKDYNVVNKIYWHQYAAAVYDAWTNAKYLAKGCRDNKEATLIFKIPVYMESDNSQVAPPPATITFKAGDANLDGVVDVKDLAAVRMHLLGVAVLSGNNYQSADTNGDAVVDVKDLAAVRMHLLGIQPLG